MSQSRNIYTNQYDQCMKELLHTPPELNESHSETMKVQQRISKSINIVACIAHMFSDLGEHHPYTDSVKKIIQEITIMEHTSQTIMFRLEYGSEQDNNRYWSDISYDGYETWVPSTFRYGYIPNE